MLPKTFDRGPRRNGPIASARHNQLGSGVQFYRYRSAARIAELLTAAGRTLRALSHEMLLDGRARQVEADNMIVQIRAEVGGDGFRDLDGRELDGTLSQHVPGDRRKSDTARRS